MGYGLIWGVFLSALSSGPHKNVSLSVLNLCIGLSNFVSRASDVDGLEMC